MALKTAAVGCNPCHCYRCCCCTAASVSACPQGSAAKSLGSISVAVHGCWQLLPDIRPRLLNLERRTQTDSPLSKAKYVSGPVAAGGPSLADLNAHCKAMHGWAMQALVLRCVLRVVFSVVAFSGGKPPRTRGVRMFGLKSSPHTWFGF
jgi:hypothetical protein